MLLEAGAPTGKIDSKASHEESEIPIFAANTKAGVNGAYALDGQDYRMILKSESIRGMQSLGAGRYIPCTIGFGVDIAGG